MIEMIYKLSQNEKAGLDRAMEWAKHVDHRTRHWCHENQLDKVIIQEDDDYDHLSSDCDQFYNSFTILCTNRSEVSPDFIPVDIPINLMIVVAWSIAGSRRKPIPVFQI